MHITQLLLIAVGLAMDAFAVSVCAGLTMPKVTVKKALIVGGYFGVFQAVMPFAGYMLAAQFSGHIAALGDWIAFILLSIIGGKMIVQSLKKEDRSGRPGSEESSLRPGRMLPLAVVTSIDALAIGVSFAFLEVNIMYAALYIGIITFTLSVVGVIIGNAFGVRFRSKAEFAGGVILVLIGVKILLGHLGIIS